MERCASQFLTNRSQRVMQHAQSACIDATGYKLIQLETGSCQHMLLAVLSSLNDSNAAVEGS